MSGDKLVFAMRMRDNPTPAEAKLKEILWPLRESHKLKFRCQAPILGWIADFYCPSRRVVIEADGKQHSEKGNLESDQHREWAMFNHHGIFTLRFSNERILSDPNAVQDEILQLCMGRPVYRSGTQKPLPRGGPFKAKTATTVIK